MHILRLIAIALLFTQFNPSQASPASQRMLLLDKNMASENLLAAYAKPWLTAGCEVSYRRYHPYLVNSDLEDYDIVMILGGTMPLATSARITREDVDLMKQFHTAGKGIVLAFPGSLNERGSDDRYAMNQFLRELRLNIEISELHANEPGLRYRSLMGEYGLVRRHEHWIYSKTDTIAFGEIMPLRILRGANLELIAESFPSATFKKGKISYPGPFQLSVYTGETAPILIIPQKVFHVFGPTFDRNASPFLNDKLLQNSQTFVKNISFRFVKLMQGQKMMLSPVIASSALESRSDSELPIWPALPSVPAADFLPVKTINFSVREKITQQEIIKSEQHFEQRIISPVCKNYLQNGIKAVWGRLTELQSNNRILSKAKALEELDALGYFFSESGCNLFWGIATPQAFGNSSLYSDAEIYKIKALWQEMSEQLPRPGQAWFAGLDYRDFRQPARQTINFQNKAEPVWSPLDRVFWQHGFWSPLTNIAKNASEFASLKGFVIDTDFYGRTPANSYTASHEFSNETVAFFRESARGFAADSLLQDFSETPADQRFSFLLDNGLLPLYYHILMEEVERFARRLKERVEAHAPEFCWGIFLPTLPNTWYEYGLLRGLSSPGKPVLLFTYEPMARTALYHLRKQNIYALHAMAISSIQVKSDEWPAFFRGIKKEHNGFWISSAESLLQEGGVRLQDKTITRDEFAKLITEAGKSN